MLARSKKEKLAKNIILGCVIPLMIFVSAVYYFAYKSMTCKYENDGRIFDCDDGKKDRDDWRYIVGYVPLAYLNAGFGIVSYSLIWWHMTVYLKELLNKYSKFFSTEDK